MMAVRESVVGFAILMFLYQQLPGCSNILKDGECMRDLAFEWTEFLNKPLREDYAAKNNTTYKHPWSDWWMVLQGFEMDWI